ncbi:MAG: NAD(P)H-binding protein [Tabrizicola sp.]|nr:NAD(P)H-binding protein [Tabrizicola sp.]
MKRVCILGISGKLGQYMIGHALERGYQVQGVCRPESVGKLARWGDRIRVFPGRTDDRAVVAEALKGCDGVLTVLVPWGVRGYATDTAKAVLDLADPGARLVFSCGWHISRDGLDRYPLSLRLQMRIIPPLVKVLRIADIGDQERAAAAIFASDRDWTVVRGSDLEEGPSEGLPVWSAHVGDPVLASNRTRRTDFALFMVAALTDPLLNNQAPAIVSRASASARVALSR